MDFLANYWHIIFTPVSVIIAYIFGGKQQQKVELKKSNSQAQQEETKAKKDLADFEREIYERIVNTMQGQFDEQNKKIQVQNEEIKGQNEQIKGQTKEIETLKETQKGLMSTIKIQDGNIKFLQETVNEYKATCDTCQFRQEKIILKKTK